MRNRKKLIALALAACTLFSTVACGAEKEPEVKQSSDVAETEVKSDVQESSDPEPTPETHDPVTLHYYICGPANQEDADKVQVVSNDL